MSTKAMRRPSWEKEGARKAPAVSGSSTGSSFARIRGQQQLVPDVQDGVSVGTPREVQRRAGGDFPRAVLALGVGRVQRQAGRTRGEEGDPLAVRRPVGVVRGALRDKSDVAGRVGVDHGLPRGREVDDAQVHAVAGRALVDDAGDGQAGAVGRPRGPRVVGGGRLRQSRDNKARDGPAPDERVLPADRAVGVDGVDVAVVADVGDAVDGRGWGGCRAGSVLGGAAARGQQRDREGGKRHRENAW